MMKEEADLKCPEAVECQRCSWKTLSARAVQITRSKSSQRGVSTSDEFSAQYLLHSDGERGSYVQARFPATRTGSRKIPVFPAKNGSTCACDMRGRERAPTAIYQDLALPRLRLN